VYCPVGGHPDLAQEEPQVAAYLSALWARMITRYHVDGIRMDTAKHVPASYFQASFFPAVRGARPDLFAVAEIWDSAQAFPPYLDAGFTSAFHFPLYYALDAAIAKGGTANAVADAIAQGIAAVGDERAKDLVLFVNNHDTPRFASEPGSTVSPTEIDRRLLLALDLIFTLPGIPQLYYGDELAMYGGPDPDNRRMLPAWATDPAQRAQPHAADAAGDSSQMFARVQRLTRLRASEPALADGDYRELWRPNGGQEVFAFARGTGTDQRIVAICNQATPCNVQVPVHGLADGMSLLDELGDGAPAVAIAGGKLPLQLAPRSAAIYRPAP
jgi:glycosidase